MMKQAMRELTRIVHPRAMVPVTLGGATVPSRVISTVLAFMLIYGAVMVGATLLLLFLGLDIVTAFTAVVACITDTPAPASAAWDRRATTRCCPHG